MDNGAQLLSTSMDVNFNIMVFILVILCIALIILAVMIRRLSASINRMERGSSAASSGGSQAARPAASEALPSGQADGQLIAAITAALMAYDGSGKRLVVRSVRKASNWSQAGRSESMNY